MRWITLFTWIVSASVLAQQDANRDRVWKDLLRCELTLEQSDGFNFDFKGEGHTVTELTLRQAASRTGAPTSPEFDVRLRALNKDGETLARGDRQPAIKHIKRLVLHELEEGFALSYAEEGGSTNSFLLTSGTHGSFLNFHHLLSSRGINYQTPTPVECTPVNDANILEADEPVSLAGLKDEEVIRVIDSFIGRRNYQYYSGEPQKLLKMTKAEWEAEIRNHAKFIMDNPLTRGVKYEGACARTRARLLTSKDHTGQELGYRLRVECADYNRVVEKVGETKKYKTVTPFHQVVTVHLANQGNRVLGKTRSENKGLSKWVKLTPEGTPAPDTDGDN